MAREQGERERATLARGIWERSKDGSAAHLQTLRPSLFDLLGSVAPDYASVGAADKCYIRPCSVLPTSAECETKALLPKQHTDSYKRRSCTGRRLSPASSCLHASSVSRA